MAKRESVGHVDFLIIQGSEESLLVYFMYKIFSRCSRKTKSIALKLTGLRGYYLIILCVHSPGWTVTGLKWRDLTFKSQVL